MPEFCKICETFAAELPFGISKMTAFALLEGVSMCFFTKKTPVKQVAKRTKKIKMKNFFIKSNLKKKNLSKV